MNTKLSELKIGDRVRVIASLKAIKSMGIPAEDSSKLPETVGVVRSNTGISVSVFFDFLNDYWFFKRGMLKLVRRAKEVQ